MDNYIIKGAGTLGEILTALKAMQAVFGKEARLTEVATATRYGRLTAITNRQLEEIEKAVN